MSKRNVLSSQTLILKYVNYKLSMSIYVFLFLNSISQLPLKLFLLL